MKGSSTEGRPQAPINQHRGSLRSLLLYLPRLVVLMDTYSKATCEREPGTKTGKKESTVTDDLLGQASFLIDREGV